MSDTELLADRLGELRERFRVVGVSFEAGRNGLIRALVATPTAEAHVYLHGAHVTHFQPRGQAPLLFMSGQSHFAPGKPIRGGIPLIFPWFGPHAHDAGLPAHGFARTQEWTLREVRMLPNHDVTLVLGLTPNAATRKLWPHEFELTYSVTVGRSLTLSLAVKNKDGTPFEFEEALHTYFAIGDIRRVMVDGLGGREYLDKMDQGARKLQTRTPFPIEAETDRVYVNTPDTVLVSDPTGGSSSGGGGTARVISVAKTGSLATVVWNPWIAKAKAMADFGDEEWPGMICIETANAAENAASLAPGATHAMTAEVRVL